MIYTYMWIQMNSEPITRSYKHNCLKLAVNIYFAVIVITNRKRETDRRRDISHCCEVNGISVLSLILNVLLHGTNHTNIADTNLPTIISSHCNKLIKDLICFQTTSFKPRISFKSPCLIHTEAKLENYLLAARSKSNYRTVEWNEVKELDNKQTTQLASRVIAGGKPQYSPQQQQACITSI